VALVSRHLPALLHHRGLVAVGLIVFGLAKLVAAAAMWESHEWGSYLLAATVALLLPFDVRQAVASPTASHVLLAVANAAALAALLLLLWVGCLVDHARLDSAAGLATQVGEAELAQPIQGVLQRPHMHDPAVAEPKDPDLINPLEAATGRGLTESFPEVGGRAGEPAHDLVALGDQLHELHVDIGEVGPERGDPSLGRRGQRGRVQLVDDLQVAAVEHRINQPTYDRLVGIGVSQTFRQGVELRGREGWLGEQTAEAVTAGVGGRADPGRVGRVEGRVAADRGNTSAWGVLGDGGQLAGRFVDAGKAGMDRSLPGLDGGQSRTERRLRHECEQLKLALAEATVQLRIWQKGSEFVDAVPSPTSRP
jgi:hypothetical protein